jgi:CheY-like chemotaxis protein
MPTVLLVEDNEMNRDMLSRRLTKKGYAVEYAEDGQAAIDCLPALMPDIVLMDMSLPVLDGLEATRQIKLDEKLQHIPVVVLTANATVTDRDASLAAGADDFETKPVNFQQLLEKMERLLGG